MKVYWNAKYFTIAVYAALTIVVSAAAVMVIFNYDSVVGSLSAFGAVITPIVIGIFCAYLLNPLMTFLERRVFGRLFRSQGAGGRKRARVLSLTCTMLAVTAVLVLVIILVIPQLITNLVSIFNNMDIYIETVRSFIGSVFENYPQIAEFLGNPLDDFSKLITNLWNTYSDELLGFAGNVAAGVWGVIDTLKNVIIGLIISIYLLAKKEMFIGQSKKLVFAFLKPERAQRFLGVCSQASEKFLGSIVGKIMEAFVVAVLVFVGCTIMGMPFAPLIAVIMFVFNLIPFVGPFIGCIPCVLLLLLSEDPIKALWFVIFIIILQNIDGNILAPWILGDSTGLPAVWILISILVGGGLFGILGMFLGVPVCAVVYMLFKDYIENRLKKRRLPQKTEFYVGNVDCIDSDFVYEEPEPVRKSEDFGKKTPFRERVRKLRRKFSEKHHENASEEK